MITIAEVLSIIDRFKRDPVGAGTDYARGAARAIPEGVASLLDLAHYPGMGSMREGLDKGARPEGNFQLDHDTVRDWYDRQHSQAFAGRCGNPLTQCCLAL